MLLRARNLTAPAQLRYVMQLRPSAVQVWRLFHGTRHVALCSMCNSLSGYSCCWPVLLSLTLNLEVAAN